MMSETKIVSNVCYVYSLGLIKESIAYEILQYHLHLYNEKWGDKEWVSFKNTVCNYHNRHDKRKQLLSGANVNYRSNELDMYKPQYWEIRKYDIYK